MPACPLQFKQVEIERGQCPMSCSHPLSMFDLFCNGQALLCRRYCLCVIALCPQAESPTKQGEASADRWPISRASERAVSPWDTTSSKLVITRTSVSAV